jgi:hypothetical protein
MVRKLLIAGIDPGTTVGYAALDTSGMPIMVSSAKGIGLDKLVQEITKEGRVIAVGTDRKKCPLLIERFAAKVGARLIKPKEDISVREKDRLTRGARNEHERDAIAAASFAYKELRPLLEKISVFAKRKKSEKIEDEVTEIVVVRKVGITKTIEQLEAE